jgi:ABC-type lipoprotein release transport system permease subunit
VALDLSAAAFASIPALKSSRLDPVEAIGSEQRWTKKISKK